MTKFTFLKSLFLAVALLAGNAVLMATEQVIYTTGFESAEGFTASTIYNNSTAKFQGPSSQQWGIVMGTTTTTGVISGSQSMQMRSYADNTTIGAIYTNFDLSKVTKVTFKAQAYSSATPSLNVYYSTDGGVNWSTPTSISITTSAVEYTYNISATGEFENLRIKIEHPTNNIKGILTIDEVKVYGMVDISSPTITVTEVSVPEMTAYEGSNDTETINVSGALLTANILVTISGTNAALFSVDPTSLTQTSGSASGAITITYSPTAVGSHTATLHLNSTGATEVTMNLSGSATAAPTAPNVFITEVYGGGGNSGAPYTNDFIELYNNTESSIDISGWSVVYYSATGTGASSNKIVIPSGKSIPGKKHFLIQGGGGTTGEALPTPDATGSINASGTAGKVILYNISDEQTINSSELTSIIGNANFVDYVPFGTTAIPVWGSAMSSNASNTTSATRKMSGGAYVYTFNIGNDFETNTPSPENTSISTGLNHISQNMKLRAVNGNIVLNTEAGRLVEVYNSVGQKVANHITNEGVNTIPTRIKGVVFVKIGSEVSKLIME